MSLSIRWLLAIMLLFSLGLDAAAGTVNKTEKYTWLLLLNQPPVVDAGAAQGIIWPNSVQLNADVTDDGPADNLVYAWTKESGPGTVAFSDASVEDPTAQFTASGIYVLQLAVTDGGNLTTTSLVTITVDNSAPEVAVSVDKSDITHPDNNVSLSATVSDEPNDMPNLTYAWTALKDGKPAPVGDVSFDDPSAKDTTAGFSVAGTYTLELTVSDWELSSLPDSVTVVYHAATVIKIVAVGDSITDGFGDSDCQYQKAKTTCSGYTPRLADKLTAANSSTYEVVDEGYGGAKSINGLNGNPSKQRAASPNDPIDTRPRPSIHELIAENPDAVQYLVRFGTNDANSALPTPSGYGLSKSHSRYPGTFKDNMEQIARYIILPPPSGAGAEPVLALAPYAKDGKAYLNSVQCDYHEDAGLPRDQWGCIEEYNEVVKEIVRDKASIVKSPPDFYTHFKNNQGQIWTDYMFNVEAGTNNKDYIHPRDTGYEAMADIWFNLLK